MARRRFTKRHHSRRKFTLPILAIAGFGPVVFNTVKHYKTYGLTGPDSATSEFIRTMTGYDPWGDQASLPRPGFQAWQLNSGLVPVIGGLFAHSLANKFGLNRMLARAGVPFLRL